MTDWASSNPQLATAAVIFVVLVLALVIMQPPLVTVTVADSDNGALPVKRLDLSMVAWLAAGGTFAWWVWPHASKAFNQWNSP